MTDVALVTMPFGPVFQPSIALSLLRSGLTRIGIGSRTFYFSVDYAERIGLRLYAGISHFGRPPLMKLAGEWIFSGAVFGTSAEAEERYVNDVLRKRRTDYRRAPRPVSEALVRTVVAARHGADTFIDECAKRVADENPRIVGLTSVFHQHLASLAIAKRLKALCPDVFIVIGGANCDGVMGAETMRQFGFLDAVVSGEGEEMFTTIVRRVLAGQAVDDLQGVYTRRNVDAKIAAGQFQPTPILMKMDEVPYPDYDEYFERFNRSRFSRRYTPRIMYETSRGCWWGERSHCTFCGLNGATMAYRSKSAPRAMEELRYLAGRYENSEIEVTDTILDLAYFKDFIPALAREKKDYTLFYETKANLRKDQVRMLRDARILRIQPGIESFSDDVLRLMRKGVTALQNVQLLKWCKEFGIHPQWNFLVGFAREPAEEYARMSRMLPLLWHLPPPADMVPIRIDRFSPNFNESEKLGFRNVRPLDAYAHVYPFDPAAIRNLAYFFNFEYQQPQNVDAYAKPLERAVRAWISASSQSDLFSIDTGDHLLIWDLRPGARHPLTMLSDASRLIYLACDAVNHPRQLASQLALDVDAVIAELERLVAKQLMLQDGGRYLALAVQAGEYSPAQPVVDRFNRVLRTLERTDQGVAVRVAHPKSRVRRLVPSRFEVDRNSVVVVH
ncbi:MAG TPA: RiPP maturation radical SAM C-methyltransferase [Thermoanaerobaculia bacterium]|nr:RiPP maturation radical SAM C-methyltransferase [Thermoanaerobaculia bacterium]